MRTIKAEYSWKIVSTDIMSLLLIISEKNTHIIVFMNLFMKYAEVFTISKINAEIVVKYTLRRLYVNMRHQPNYYWIEVIFYWRYFYKGLQKIRSKQVENLIISSTDKQIYGAI
jgi:hypothetical protein